MEAALYFLADEFASAATALAASSSGSKGFANTSTTAPVPSSPGLSFKEFMVLLFQICLVFGPHIGYVVQYYEIHQTKDIEGYSPLVSLILLISNMIRIYYFIGEHFALALLFQAMVAILVHALLLYKVLTVRQGQLAIQAEQRMNAVGLSAAAGGVPVGSRAAPLPGSPFARMEDEVNTAIGGHGRWPEEDPALAKKKNSLAASATDTRVAGGGPQGPGAAAAAAGGAGLAPSTNHTRSPASDGTISVEFTSPTQPNGADRFFIFRLEGSIEGALLRLEPGTFVFFYAISSLLGLIVSLGYYLIIGNVWSGAASLVGYVALGIEAMLVIPQILRNARRRSTEGLTMVLVLTWVLGDAVKIVYFTVDHQPLPFILCGCFQLCLDFVVIGQIIAYRCCTGRPNSLPNSSIHSDDRGGSVSDYFDIATVPNAAVRAASSAMATPTMVALPTPSVAPPARAVASPAAMSGAAPPPSTFSPRENEQY